MNQKNLKNIISEIIFQKIPFCLFYGVNKISYEIPVNPVILSGSFNPFHVGHKQMLLAAQKETSYNPFLEISITNVDKDELKISDIQKKIDMIIGHKFPLIVSNAPRFFEKSHLFPKSIFLIGNDTFERLFDLKYYNDIKTNISNSSINLNLEILKKNGCKFLVAGRTTENNIFTNMNSSLIPKKFEFMFSTLKESQFRNDISSTQIRNYSKEN
ncbi:MAG: hypothetical protein CL740_05045 [Chloroflexi bacterium]|nr:hypothetical protein [Chloroflexota bacterium]|tara:strand:+ start:2367 stop:3008 length:642 start_codon:yes stop_codon:yes gene_type:complete